MGVLQVYYDFRLQMKALRNKEVRTLMKIGERWNRGCEVSLDSGSLVMICSLASKERSK